MTSKIDSSRTNFAIQYFITTPFWGFSFAVFCYIIEINMAYLKPLKSKKFFAGIIIFALIAVTVWYFFREKKPLSDFEIAKRGNISQEVSVTGRVKSTESVDLAFERSGKVATVSVKVGDKVKTGQALATLVNTDISAQLHQAMASVESAKATLNQYQAALEAQQAKFEELKIGTRAEELQIAETKVSSAQKVLADAENNLANVKNKATIDLGNLYDGVKDVLNDAYVKADDAVNKQTDEMFTDDNTENLKLTFFTSNQLEIDSKTKRYQSGLELKQFKTELDILFSDEVSLNTALVKGENHLKIIQDFLDTLNDAVANSINLNQTTITNYRYYINAARTNINTALTNVNTKKQAIATQKATSQVNISTAEASVNSAKNSLKSAQDELALKKAGATTEQIASQEASVNQAKANIESQQAQIKYAEANVENFQAQLDKTMIFSPLNGVVTKRDLKVGEIVVANVNVISIISESQFEIEANVPEADIAKVKVVNLAKVTLDTYGSDVVFEAKVIKIDPAETILEGVATYKATFQFIQDDERIKSGMTANIDILTAKKDNVVFLPQRAIIQKEGGKFVLIEKGENQTEEKKIEIGLRGSDGNVEIVSGLSENEKVIISREK